jgi:hypothetical protein
MLQPALAHETRHRGRLAVYQRPLGIELTHTEQFRRYTSQISSTSNLKEADMKKINLGRVLLGGLIAGVVLNIGEYLLNEVVLGDDMRADFARLGLSQPGGDFIAKAVIATFVLGVVITYLYAAIRTQFGPGVKTAIYAGLFAWFFVTVYTGVINGSLGLFSMKLLLIGCVWGLVEYSLGAIAGAWLYKEAKA